MTATVIMWNDTTNNEEIPNALNKLPSIFADT